MKTQRIALVVLALVIASLVACTPITESGTWSGTVSSKPLQGNFGGKAFAMASGYAEVGYFDSTKYSIAIYNISSATANPWDFGAYPYGVDHLKVMFSFPKAVGSYPLKLDLTGGVSQTVTLYDSTDGMNYICTEGVIRIDQITDDGLGNKRIIGAVAAYGTTDNYANGTFNLAIAP